jgi:predicted Zn-dependent protease
MEDSGKSAFILTSVSQEASLGAQSFTQIKSGGRVSRDPVANAQVQRVANNLIKVINMPDTQWEVVVFDDPTPNAFALPGGKIGVNTGILPLTVNDAGLAAVIGHELAHVKFRHGGQRMTRDMGIQYGSAAVGALLDFKNVQNRDMVMGALGVGAQVGLTLPFSRGDESEADHYGLIYMARAGYDPREAVGFWQRMEDYSKKSGNKTSGLLSTHPSDAARVKQIQQWLPEAEAVHQQTARNNN